MPKTLCALTALAALAATIATLHAETRQVRRPQPTYEACYALAMKRGWSSMGLDSANLDDFITKCMQGRIPL